jgi:hypothetical protein
MANLVWHNEPGRDKSDVEALIWKDLNSSIYTDMLHTPSCMITHTVFLGPSMDQGPVVHLWGKPGDDENLHCEWADDVKWVSVGHDDIDMITSMIKR